MTSILIKLKACDWNTLHLFAVSVRRRRRGFDWKRSNDRKHIA